MWKRAHLSDQYEVSTDGLVRNAVTGHVLKPMFNSCKYHRVDIHGKSTAVHRLVAIAFIDNPNNLPEVGHKNGIKTDNRVNNLEWTTKSDNQIHAYKTGLRSSKGTKNKAAKLNEAKVLEIRAKSLKWCGFSATTLGKEYGVYHSVIEKIRARRLWSHI